MMLAATETPLTIDQLLAQGWEIAGYASGYDNRTLLILFRHPGVNPLVQCGVLYDVTRVPNRQWLGVAISRLRGCSSDTSKPSDDL
jgi:hypothetical protein